MIDSMITEPTQLRFRPAVREDAGRIAELHADSWRRHYRGAYADSFLDSDVITDRQQLWTARLAEPDGSATILAEDDDGLAGFVHVRLDHDDRWGSLVDNLHVRFARKRSGIGRTLITAAAAAVTERAERPALYLWVLEQNTAAQGFYAAAGGVQVERGLVPPPGGVEGRLNGNPACLRFAWPEPVTID